MSAAATTIGRPRFAAVRLDKWFMQGGKAALFLFLLMALLFPLLAMLVQAFSGSLENLSALISGHFWRLLVNSINVSLCTVAVVIPLAYLFAYGLQRTRFPGRALLRGMTLLPLMAPSMLSAISLIYLFGNQGLLKSWFPHGIYGFPGILIGQAFYNFPVALMIFVSALSMTDGRLYDAAISMGARPVRIFLTITWPQTRYAVFAASSLVFTQTITDFGIPVIVGGDYNVLATEAYKAIIGQQQFAYGAMIGTMLLIPAVVSFVVDRWMRRFQSGLGSRAAPYRVERNSQRDTIYFVIAALFGLAFLAIMVTAVVASFIGFWPYDMSFSLRHYDFETSGGVGWMAFRNSLQFSILTALIGTPLVLTSSYIMERALAPHWLDGPLKLLCLLPMAIPGLVMGLGYVFFFNALANPLNGLYGGMALMVVCCIVHFFTPAQMTANAALSRISRDFEAASVSLKVPLLVTYLRVILPMCLSTAVEIFRYLFVSAITSVSALMFLYSPDTILASIAILNMDDAGNIGGAAALSTLILAASAMASLLLKAFSGLLLKRTEAWRTRR